MKCKHRIDKDICEESWATPYDNIYECKRYRKKCPRFKKESEEK